MILSLDYGERYIGVAISDADETLALRHSTIDQKRENGLEYLKELIVAKKITKVLVGKPIGLSGIATAQTKTTDDFVALLKEAIPAGVDIEMVDERYTSVEAQRRVQDEGGSAHFVHQEAARLLLDSYLRKRNL